MNEKLLSVLKQAVAENGVDILSDIEFMGEFLASNAADTPKSEVMALMLCLAMDYPKELLATSDSERITVKAAFAERIYHEDNMDILCKYYCTDTIGMLCSVLFDELQTVEMHQSVTEGFHETDEFNRMEKIVIEKTEENISLSERLGSLEQKRLHTRNGLVTTLVFLGVSIIIIFSVYNNMDDKNTSLLWDNISLADQVRTLRNEYAESKKIWALNVTDMKVGNENQYSQWITKPGVPLITGNIRYLNPVFTYSSPITGTLQFYIKIKDPQGDIMRGDRSPQGYSYSEQYQIKRGQNLSFDPGGFGNSTSSNYYRGLWTIELWCENFCLYSGTVEIE